MISERRKLIDFYSLACPSVQSDRCLDIGCSVGSLSTITMGPRYSISSTSSLPSVTSFVLRVLGVRPTQFIRSKMVTAAHWTKLFIFPGCREIIFTNLSKNSVSSRAMTAKLMSISNKTCTGFLSCVSEVLLCRRSPHFCSSDHSRDNSRKHVEIIQFGSTRSSRHSFGSVPMPATQLTGRVRDEFCAILMTTL